MATTLVNLWGTPNADIVSDSSSPTLTLKNTGTAAAVKAVAPISSGATIAPLNVVASVVSQAVMQVSGVFMSTASINTTGAAAAFIMPVYHETAKVWGYLTASKGVQ